MHSCCFLSVNRDFRLHFVAHAWCKIFQKKKGKLELLWNWGREVVLKEQHWIIEYLRVEVFYLLLLQAIDRDKGKKAKKGKAGKKKKKGGKKKGKKGKKQRDLTPDRYAKLVCRAFSCLGLFIRLNSIRLNVFCSDEILNRLNNCMWTLFYYSLCLNGKRYIHVY